VTAIGKRKSRPASRFVRVMLERVVTPIGNPYTTARKGSRWEPGRASSHDVQADRAVFWVTP